MKKSNLFLILTKLDKREQRELRKWLQSPAHNQRPDVILLFEFMLENLSTTKQVNLTKESAFPVVYPDMKTFDDGKMRQSIHFLYKSVEEFLVFSELQQDQVKAKITFAKVLSKKGIDKGFEKSIHSAYDIAKKKSLRNMIYHQNDHEIRQEEIRFAGLQGRGKGFDFQGLSDSLDLMYISSKLRESCTMISYQNINKTEYNTGLLDKMLAHIDDNPNLLKVPAIGIYYFGLKCSTDNDDELSFRQLKEEIFNSKDLFPPFELRDLYTIAINFCIRRMNSGDKPYFRACFELYNQGVDQEVLLNNGQISRFAFLNMVSIGAQLKEFDWLDNFLDKKAALLPANIRENVSHYGRSKYHFEKGNYDEAMNLLSQIEYDDVLLNLIGKGMLVRIFYEKEFIDSLESLLESMRAYVQRKKVIGYHKSSFSNLIKYTRKLMKVNPYDKKEVQKLKEQIEAANPLPEKSWLINQIEKL